MKHLQALLQGKCTSHILPFLWMKGEDNETIGKELDKIEKCGIREVSGIQTTSGFLWS